MKGRPIASSASRRATLVCVKAAGLTIRKATPSPRARWIRSTSSCSALLWKLTTSCPAARPAAARRASICASVVAP